MNKQIQDALNSLAGELELLRDCKIVSTDAMIVFSCSEITARFIADVGFGLMVEYDNKVMAKVVLYPENTYYIDFEVFEKVDIEDVIMSMAEGIGDLACDFS